jgi:hypothetical protein
MDMVKKYYDNSEFEPKYIYLLHNNEKKIIYQKNPSIMTINNNILYCYVQDTINNNMDIYKYDTIILMDDNEEEYVLNSEKINKKIIENMKDSRNIVVNIIRIKGEIVCINKIYECNKKIIITRVINEKILALIFGTFGAMIMINTILFKTWKKF